MNAKQKRPVELVYDYYLDRVLQNSSGRTFDEEIQCISYPDFANLVDVRGARLDYSDHQISQLVSELIIAPVSKRRQLSDMSQYEAYYYFKMLVDLWNITLDALIDERLKLTKSGRIDAVEFADFVNAEVTTIEEVFGDSNRYIHKPEIEYLARQRDNDDGAKTMDLTPMMNLILRGRQNWWGGIDTENEYRGDQAEIRQWFVMQGADKEDARAFAKAIAPAWVLKGGSRASKRRVDVVDNS